MITDDDALRYIDIFMDDCEDDDDFEIVDCAGNLCRIDIEKFGYDEWKKWTPEDIVKIFIEVTDSTMSDLLDELSVEVQVPSQAVVPDSESNSSWR